MSQSGSRTRAGVFRTLFEPGLEPGDYSPKNLEAFARAAGPAYLKQYNDAVEATKERLKAEGVSHVTPEYRRALQNTRFQFLRDLYRNHRELHRRITAPVKKEKLVTSDDVSAIFNHGGADELLKDIEEGEAANFNLNALKEAAKLLGVKGSSEATKGKKGDDAKEAVRDLILDNAEEIQERSEIEKRRQQAYNGRHTAEELSKMNEDQLREVAKRLGVKTTGTKKTLIKNILSRQAPISVNIGYTESALKSMRVDQLRNILRNMGLSPTGNKDPLIERILENQGRMGEAPGVSVADTLAEIKSIAEEQGAIPARELAASIDPDVYQRASTDDLKELSALLALKVEKAGSTATKEEYIRALTHKSSALQRSRERTRVIQADLSLCEESTDEELQEAARELKLNIRGLDKHQICALIYEKYLYRFSSLMLEEFGPEGKSSFSKLAGMTPAARKRAIENLARRSKYAPVSTLPDLLREFLFAHYRTRALRYAPDSLDVLNAYLMDGIIPNNMRDLEGLAGILSDISPDLYTFETVEAITTGLDEIYKAFIRVIAKGEEGSTNLLMDRMANFTYSPPRRNIGPLSRPRQAVQQFPAEQPLEHLDERQGEEEFERQEEEEEELDV